MISVVIPAFNEEKLLGRCLVALAQQKTERPFEVVVVDNGSTDATATITTSFATQLSIRLVYESRKGRGQARHTGFRAALGDIILSTDADAIVPSDWIEHMCERLESNPAAAVAGPAKIYDCGLIANTLFNMVQPLSAVSYRLFFSHYWLPGFNFAIRRSAYFSAGEFDASMDALEDNDLSWRVRAVGKIIFARDIPVIFSGRRFRGRFVRALAEHVTAFCQYYVGGVKRMVWSDIR